MSLQLCMIQRCELNNVGLVLRSVILFEYLPVVTLKMSPANFPCSQSPQSVLDYRPTHTVLKPNLRYPAVQLTVSLSPILSVLQPNPQYPTAYTSVLQPNPQKFYSPTHSILLPNSQYLTGQATVSYSPNHSIVQPNPHCHTTQPHQYPSAQWHTDHNPYLPTLP